VSLTRKLELFKDVNRDLLPFEPLRATASDLLSRIKALMDDRHWMAHGYLQPSECTDAVWVLHKHEFPKETGGLAIKKRTFTRAEVIELRWTLISLVNDMADYVNALAIQVTKQDFYDQRS